MRLSGMPYAFKHQSKKITYLDEKRFFNNFFSLTFDNNYSKDNTIISDFW